MARSKRAVSRLADPRWSRLLERWKAIPRRHGERSDYGLFVCVTALAELTGCYLPYQWRRRSGSPWLLLDTRGESVRDSR